MFVLFYFFFFKTAQSAVLWFDSIILPAVLSKKRGKKWNSIETKIKKKRKNFNETERKTETNNNIRITKATTTAISKKKNRYFNVLNLFFTLLYFTLLYFLGKI